MRTVRAALRWPAAGLAMAGLTGVALLLYGTYVERHRVRLRRLEIVVPGLQAAFDAYCIVQLSDFHAGGKGWSLQTLRRAVALAAEQRADLVVLTGDFVENTQAIAPTMAAFATLRAPDGLLAVLGNHDYHAFGVRTAAIVQGLGDAGVRVLRNESYRVRRDGQDLWIVGLDDAHSGHDYLPKALRGVPAATRPVLLSHYPDFAWRLAPDRFAVVLSGHAHGGQIRLPFLDWYARHRIAETRFSHGLYQINRTPVFVTTGVGTSGHPIRVLAPPEVAVIRLRAAPPARVN